MAGWLSMKRVALIAVTVGIMNFVAFVAGTFIVGGDAINADSRCPPGRHCLWDKRLQEPCNEVSEGIYLYSKWHAYSVFLSWPPVIASLLYLNRRVRRTIFRRPR